MSESRAPALRLWAPSTAGGSRRVTARCQREAPCPGETRCPRIDVADFGPQPRRRRGATFLERPLVNGWCARGPPAGCTKWAECATPFVLRQGAPTSRHETSPTDDTNPCLHRRPRVPGGGPDRGAPAVREWSPRSCRRRSPSAGPPCRSRSGGFEARAPSRRPSSRSASRSGGPPPSPCPTPQPP
jgi:hypothetical protein